LSANISVGRFPGKCAIGTSLYNSRMCILQTTLLALALATVASAQQSISFPVEDGTPTRPNPDAPICLGLHERIQTETGAEIPPPENLPWVGKNGRA
jgi:hypothetical protein